MTGALVIPRRRETSTPSHEMLGHANAATTLSVYAHLMPGDQEEALRRLEAALAP